MSPITRNTGRDGRRFYEWRNEKYWSVTTIIGGGLPKPALINWAKKYTAEYAYDNLKILAEMQEAGDRDGAVDWLKNASFRDRDRKAELGSEVHQAIEAYMLGKPFPKWSKEAAPRMEQFELFLAEHEPTYLAAEAPIFNRTQKYAGTLDAIVHLPKLAQIHLQDVKTGKGVYPDAALQLAAYRFAEFIGQADGDEVPMSKVDGCSILHLTDDKWDLIPVKADEEVFNFFLYVREVYRWSLETSKGVLNYDERPVAEALQQTLDAA
jgi:hypothetical protein